MKKHAAFLRCLPALTMESIVGVCFAEDVASVRA